MAESITTRLQKLNDWFRSLQIRVKLVIIIGLLFVGLMSLMSLFIIQQGKRILNERLDETCTMSLRHVSQAIKNDLLLYYRTGGDPNASSLHLGHIRESILAIYSENIEGLEYACVIDKNGVIIAHTDPEQINRQVTKSDRLLFAGLNITHKREDDDIIEYIHPLYTSRENGSERRFFLGDTILGFSKNIILKPINQSTSIIISATIFIITFSVLAIFFIAKRMTKQIDALVEGVRKMSKGDMDSQIPVLAMDELGRLAKEFNSMMVHLREKLQMQKFVSKLTVQMIRRRANTSELPPIGEKREVTLLFSDIRSFSALTEQLGAEEIVKLINIYLDLQARIVEENGGIVDKFIGDQVMAIFIGSNQADAAIHAAVEIQRSIRELNKRRNRTGEVVLKVGCGVHIGDAVLGNMGSSNRLDYTVIGEVVNLAARLCALAKPGQIIAPVEMVHRLNGEYPTIRLDSVRVKGRSQSVEIFQIDYDRAIIM